ncbi:MAG: hypothetical protein F7C35_01475 [Desulfurococcales archaeon]|nr:hypothetical protein [Desulfurococcales archaeon]
MEAHKSPVFLYSILKVQWGYIVRQPGATAAQAAYILPPPTTVVGAFANPLARILGVPDYTEKRRRIPLPVRNRYMECLLTSTLAAGAGLVPSPKVNVGVVTYEEPSRIMGTPYKAGGSYQAALKKPIYLSITELLPVQAAGAASAPDGLVAIAWLFDIERLGHCMEVEVSLEDLERAAWGVYRLGSREGLSYPLLAGAARGNDLDIISEGIYESLLYQDLSCASKRSGLTSTVPLTGLDYVEREYIVPSGPIGGVNVITPPPEPPVFYIREPGCRAAGVKVSFNGEDLNLYLAFRG